MKEILQLVYWNNTVQNYLIALGVFIGGILFIRLIRKGVVRYLRNWAEKSEGSLDDFLVSVLEQNLLPIFNIGVFYLAMKYLSLPEKGDRILNILYGIAVTWFVVRIILRLIKHALDQYAEKQDDPETKKKQMRSLMAIVKMLIWLVALIMLLSNLGFNVTGIVAGLGIGGIAIALAAQAILGDLFSYFVIFFDKPFEPGDFIQVDDKRGTVEKVGLKTTRVRALTGEQLIFSNTNLTNSRVHNFKKLERRRIVFTIGVTYQTPAEKLEAIPGFIKDIISNREGVTFDRAHFSAFADSSLNFEIVYFIEQADYTFYMDQQQDIYLSMVRKFQAENIEFAYPTQTVYEYKMGEIHP
ncbi:MAG: mechanosensitive ion channel family protein [Chitinophagaceae bacterium]|jgi:small-conductance mechanosensitive channel|nr:mechanosensitive ion channel family protein [Chitinophagaceae bacterium]